MSPNVSCNCSCNSSEVFRCDFKDTLPWVYMICSIPSVISCILVFITYAILRRKLPRFLARVLFYRTVLDFLIAVIHITSFIAHSAKNDDNGCKVLGALLQFALFASSAWYFGLAIDLLFSIRNPFSLGSKLRLRYHAMVWIPSLATAIVLVATGEDAKHSGRSMFYYCWVSVKKGNKFNGFSWGLLMGPQIVFFIVSAVILLFSIVALGRRLPINSKTRTQVLRKNAWYILVVTFETVIAGGIWLVEFILNSGLCFCKKRSYDLAIAFAVVHSLRGVVDCVTWFVIFSIGPKDFRYLWQRCMRRFSTRSWSISTGLDVPLLISGTSVDQSLRRGVIYCINRGILDVVDQAVMREADDRGVGSATNKIVAAIMLEHADAEEDQKAAQTSSLESTTRMIKFKPSSNLSGSFTFVNMEPSIFRLLWKSQKLNLQNFKQSFFLEDINDVDSTGLLEKFTEGKSGSFFYFTLDHRYIIKTVSSEEEKFLRKIARRYYNHIKDNPETLIVRLYGLYQVRLAWEQKYISVIVMENIFHSIHQLKIHEKYDLKGSTIGRRVIKGSSAPVGSSVLKDLDLNKKVYVGPENKTAIMDQLQKDTAFLTSVDIMDYSLLLGIHDHNGAQNQRVLGAGSIATGGFEIVNSLGGSQRSTLKDQLVLSREETFIPVEVDPWFRQDFGGLRSYTPHHPIYNMEGAGLSRQASENDFPSTYDGVSINELPVATYYFGIVDILQQYNVRKKLEHFWKTRITRLDPHGISAVEPREYRQRFLRFISKVFE